MVKTIAFIGIDGAGKTTIIEKVIKSLEEEGIKCKRRYMGLGREYQLKFVESLIGKYHRGRKKRTKRMGIGLESNYRERGFGWVLVQYVELWARFIREKIGKKKIVLFDRYFYDGLILGNERVFSFFRRITPKPTKCFLVYADSKIIRKRKKEAEVGDIKKFYERVEKLKGYFDIELVDNNQRLGKIVNKITNEIKNV